MHYKILDIQPPIAILSLENSRTTFEINFKEGLLFPEIVHNMLNGEALTLGLMIGAFHNKNETEFSEKSLNLLTNEVGTIKLQGIVKGKLSFLHNHKLFEIQQDRVLNNADIIDQLSAYQAHYVGFLIGYLNEFNEIEFSNVPRPYLKINLE